MAQLSTIIRKVRRRVRDSDITSDGRPIYADEFYEDIVEDALAVVNLDLGESYTIATLPAAREIFLIYKATCEMALVRGAEGASADADGSSNLPEASIQSLSVPDLTISKTQVQVQGPRFWKDLYDRVCAKYDNLLSGLEEDGDIGTAVSEVVLLRRSLRTGRRIGYEYDTAISARTLAAAVAAGVVELSWDAVVDEYFTRHVLYRSASSSMINPTVVTTVVDAHLTDFEDEPGVGTWYYRIDTYNTNSLYSSSAVASAVVA